MGIISSFNRNIQMKKLLCFFLSISCLAQINLNLVPSAPNLANKGYVLISGNTGNIIAQQNADKKIEPASLTKLMTLFIVANALEQKTISLEDEVLISKKAWKQPGSRMFIKAGDRVKLKLLIQGSAVVSGNDATVALAEHIAGSEAKFAELMNTTAEQIGMKNTHFSNSTGLTTKNHFTTPNDLALLAKNWLENYPDKIKWFQQKYFKYNKIKQHNRNQQLWSNPLVTGMKTGYTKSAGYCLITSANNQKENLIAVIAGAKTINERFEQSNQLLNYGFHFFESKIVASPNNELGNYPIYLGQKDYVKFAPIKTINITIPKNYPSKIEITTHINKKLQAPISKGTIIGTAEIVIGEYKENVKIMALEDVQKANFLAQMISYGKMLIV